MKNQIKNPMQQGQRLDDWIIPINYTLLFKTNFKSFRFEGNEDITLHIARPVKSIRINSNKIKIKSARVVSKGETINCRIKLDPKNKIAYLGLEKEISGSANLLIDFEGINNDDMYGFYRSSYTTKSGKTEYMLASQFEAADARAAFPCFDEPKFKATFNVTIEIPKDFTAISNMPVKSERVSGGIKTVKFFTTPKMSTYLLFLGVGKFDKISTNLGNLKINAYSTRGKGNLCKMALGYAKKFIEFYEGYFRIKYPLPKVDLIAIPDFAAGAMENWGAITFRETAMLGDEKTSSISSKEQIAETVAHELAHQWFGDLVTMEWWNDLWLNESFATFMSFKAMDAVFPEWQTDVQYFDEVIATAFSADALVNTHPISVDVSTPEEINEIFDEISYEKGGTFLHMLEDFATPKIFRSGLHDYLKAHSYSNATKYDLWNAISASALKHHLKIDGKIREFANKWLENYGYPILIQDDSDPKKFSQQRFVISKPLSSSDDGQLWLLEVKCYDLQKRFSKLMGKKVISMPYAGSGALKLNYGQDYLYRVKYSDSNLEKIGLAIKEGKLSALDAWGVEGDLFSLVRSGNSNLNQYLRFIRDYCMNVGYPANSSILGHIDWLDFMLAGTKEYSGLRDIGSNFAMGILKKLGWSKKPQERSVESMTRSHAIRVLGQFEDKETVSKARKMLDSYFSGKVKLDPDLKTPIYVTCAANGDMKLLDKLLTRYKEEKIPEEKRRLLQTLGYFRGKKEIHRALEVCMSKDVRLQDSFVIPAILSSNPAASSALKKWTFENWQKLKKKYDIGTHMLPRFVDNFSMLSNKEDYSEIKGFFGKKANYRGDIKISFAKTLERISANKRFIDKNAIKK
ncbi:M1 family metallopeptidase [Candidatus Marsarchaeota archaeon]|nr:M1 family metallopeptidase [Candidatus Marsarchaeota archaeon]